MTITKPGGVLLGGGISDFGSGEEASMNVLVLTGPTASGKTSVGVALARLLDGEIISADSRQIYRGLDIGTAKPSAEEMRLVRHHFIDVLDPGEEYSAGLFGEQARHAVQEILHRKKKPVVVGGSGLYIRSLIDGLHAAPGADRDLRRRLERRAEEEGLCVLLEELRQVDPAAVLKMRPPTVRRVVRALEVYLLTGIPLSQHQRSGGVAVPFGAVLFGLEWDRRALYDRIDRRCEAMVEAGLLEEIERLEGRGYGLRTNALNTVGYKEGREYRRGRISFAEMMRLFKQNSRRYAKRQLTWFRRDLRIRWIRMEEGRESDDVAEEIVQRLAVGH